MARNLYGVMTGYLTKIVSTESSEILEESPYEKKDDSGSSVEKGTRYLAEITDGAAHKARYYVKIPNSKKLFTDEQLEDGVLAKFADVTVSYIDTKKREIYFKASNIIAE